MSPVLLARAMYHKWVTSHYLAGGRWPGRWEERDDAERERWTVFAGCILDSQRAEA
jgi:hypothetical protein